MLTTILIGFASSIVAEVITWINAKLSGTVLKGDGAFLFAAFISLIAAIVEVFIVPTATWHQFVSQFSLVWASSQAFFLLVVQLFGLDVKPNTEPQVNQTQLG